MKWIEWIEPFGVNNEPVFMRVKPEVAIERQKANALLTKRKYIYESDEQALEDFMVVHWAELKECTCCDVVEVK